MIGEKSDSQSPRSRVAPEEGGESARIARESIPFQMVAISKKQGKSRVNST